ncbi:MAG TPA: hypothetical protein VLA61_26110 [Ideonella sp.]|uniref:hypothetical protein n=1 Tax=Ideonella sp. TaxID=1929293 RepID=UPI002C3C44B7|nr:hypothetical protein [Ideonella sp.]HSI51758.1 hypothetical protein [Ideonella sp.]
MPLPMHQPFTRPIAEALGANATLGRLLERLRESEARMATVRLVLPAALAAHVRPGVLDDEGWNLLVPNSAVAAKLRQCLPLLAQVLADQGWPRREIRVKVQSERA